MKKNSNRQQQTIRGEKKHLVVNSEYPLVM